MNETKTKNIRAVKSGAGLVITLPVAFCRKAGIKKGDVLGLTYDSVVIIAVPRLPQKPKEKNGLDNK